MRLTLSYLFLFTLLLAAGLRFGGLSEYGMVMMAPLLALAGLLGWLLAGRTLQPLQELVSATRKISVRNLYLRIPPQGTRDELDTLTHNFNQMLDRLERNFEQARQFSVDASHELRTPITAARGQLEVALMSATTVEEHRAAMESALQDLERMGQIVKSLLQLAQAESGQLALQKARLDVARLVARLAGEFEIPADEKRARLTCVLQRQCEAMVDRVQFERLVSNLLSNAIRYVPPHGEVRVSLSSGGGKINLTVSDNGPGIPAPDLPHIFDRFYRARKGEPDGEKGLGLGLSFASWIVDAHGGTIDVKSTQGSGTTFLVTIPAGLEGEAFPILRSEAGQDR